MKIEIISVTPKLAAQWLATNTDRNRRISKNTVNRYAQDMIRNQWLVTGEAIKFDREGRLIDGQHRLSAIVASQKTVQMCVIRDLDEATMHVIDTGKSRSAGDALTISGHNGMSNEMAALARKIIAFTGGSTQVLGVKKVTLKGATITNRDIVEFCAQNDLSEHCRFATRIKYQQLTSALNVGEYAFFHWYFSRIDPCAAETFLSQVATLENVDANSAIRTLIQKITKSAASLNSQQRLHATVTAWNAWRSGTTINIIRVGRLESEAAIPKAI